jgi:hypothetical protein
LENKLRILYALQLVDTALDELEEMKGDLPAETRQLEEKIAKLEADRTALEKAMKEAFIARDEADSGIISFREKREKYRSQQLAVRNNREYDALTREIDFATEEIQRLEDLMESLENKAMTAKNDIAAVNVQLEETKILLEEKRQALTEITKAHEEEELKHRHEREKLLVRLDKTHLEAYDRIRKAKKGKAVVPVRRGACGGCFAKVPPQKILELRQNDRIYHCEHCGRIIVSDEIVETASTNA